MKNVFRYLIQEAPYLIDDKAAEMCLSMDPKEALKTKIDSIRKSLNINDIDDVNLLVDELYKFQETHEKKLEEERKRMQEEEEEEAESGAAAENGVAGAPPVPSLNEPKKASNEATLNADPNA